jgi:hypothetical protein
MRRLLSILDRRVFTCLSGVILLFVQQAVVAHEKEPEFAFGLRFGAIYGPRDVAEYTPLNPERCFIDVIYMQHSGTNERRCKVKYVPQPYQGMTYAVSVDAKSYRLVGASAEKAFENREECRKLANEINKSIFDTKALVMTRTSAAGVPAIEMWDVWESRSGTPGDKHYRSARVWCHELSNGSVDFGVSFRSGKAYEYAPL